MYKVKKLICTLLAVCIISTTLAQPVQAFTGAEGAILGGGAGLASISLTAPQVALLVAAGFGIVVAVENADKLAEGMTVALETAAAGVDAGAEVLEQWLDAAKKGSIAIAGAPAWIAGAIKGWISGLYEDKLADLPVSGVSHVASLPANTPIVGPAYWGTTTYKAGVDSIALRAGSVTPTSSGYSLLSYLVLYSIDTPMKEAQYSVVIDGHRYDFFFVTWGGSISSNPSSEHDQTALRCVSSLLDINEIYNNYSSSLSGWSERTGKALALIHAHLNGELSLGGGSVCPNVKVGGIGAALEEGKSIDSVNMPDLDVAGSKSICPDGVLDGSIPIADTVADVIVGLTDGTLSWSDYVTDVAVGTPTISVPVEGTESGVVDYPITDTGVSDTPIEQNPDTPGEGTEVPEGLVPYTVQLKDFFPFCIPFDIVDFVGVLCADPVAPAFEWTFTQYSGQKDTLVIDLSPFDEVAQLLRNMELLLFIIGLAFLTRNLIRG